MNNVRTVKTNSSFTTSSSLIKDSKDETISIASLNMQQLLGHGREELFDELLKFARKYNPDVICLQEMFSGEERHRLTYRLLGESISLDYVPSNESLNSPVNILYNRRKLKQLDAMYINFDKNRHGAWVSNFSHKYKKNSKPIQCVSLHQRPGIHYRQRMYDLHKLLEELPEAIIAGDFNTVMPREYKVIRQLATHHKRKVIPSHVAYDMLKFELLRDNPFLERYKHLQLYTKVITTKMVRSMGYFNGRNGIDMAIFPKNWKLKDRKTQMPHYGDHPWCMWEVESGSNV